MHSTNFIRKFHDWADRYFYRPNFIQKLIAFALTPLCAIYFCIVFLKFKLSREHDFGLPIVSVGNLTLGGSGKTPLCIAIANEFEGGFIVLRGYKRASKGLVKICINGQILTDVYTSGDEAMQYAKLVKNANVIVSEDRDRAIILAREMGAKYILLDDGFGKFHIRKFNLLIEPKFKPYFKFCLPSGAYRYPSSFANFADYTLKEGGDFTRESRVINPTKKMVLVTAIANPFRLKEHFSSTVAQIFYPDHHSFSREELVEILAHFQASSLLVTQKDFVKIENFGLPVSLITLKTTLSPKFKELIKANLV